MFCLAWICVCNQLEQLKQKQKLNRQKEHEKKRKLEAKKNAAKIKEKTDGKVGVWHDFQSLKLIETIKVFLKLHLKQYVTCYFFMLYIYTSIIHSYSVE